MVCSVWLGHPLTHVGSRLASKSFLTTSRRILVRCPPPSHITAQDHCGISFYACVSWIVNQVFRPINSIPDIRTSSEIWFSLGFSKSFSVCGFQNLVTVIAWPADIPWWWKKVDIPLKSAGNEPRTGPFPNFVITSDPTVSYPFLGVSFADSPNMLPNWYT